MNEMHDKVRIALSQLAAATEQSSLQPPADSVTLRLVNRALNQDGYSDLPADYAFLLSQTCGIQGPYFTLLSPGAMPSAGGGIRAGIHQQSEAFNAGSDENAKLLVLGRTSGDTLLAFTDGKYQLVDVHSREYLRSYDSVADFITHMLTLKDPQRRPKE